MIFKDNHGDNYTIDFKPMVRKYFCPACHSERKNKKDRSLHINRNSNIGKCYHCDRVFFPHNEVDNIVKEYKKPKDLETKISKQVIDYFKTRGISESSLNYLKVTSGLNYMPQVEKETNCIKFNYYKSDKLINIKYRDNSKNFKFETDCEVTFYNYDAVYNFDKIIVVEGEIDALSFVEAGIFNVVSLPNGCNNVKFLNQYIFDIERVKEWVLCVDKDNGGIASRSELMGKLGIEKCLLVNTKDCKDANGYLLKYGKEGLQKIYADAERIIEDDNSYDIDFIINEGNIDETIKLKPYNIILGEKREYGITEIITSGNLSMISGKAKSRKTFSLMALCSLIIGENIHYISNCDNGIVLFDTEQFKHHSLRFYKRLSKIADISKFKMINLRAYSKETRLNFIKGYINTYKPTLAIIDNVRDIIKDFNDIGQSDEILTALSNLSETTETHIMCTLHTNKADNNARGHLGAEITQKSETVFLIQTDENINVTDISPFYTRNEKFTNIQFEISEGVPFIYGKPKVQMNNQEEEEPF